MTAGFISIGISANTHDSAAAVLRDGHVIAAASEERFTRTKHDASFPVNALSYCLQAAECKIQDVDRIGFFETPSNRVRRLLTLLDDDRVSDAKHLTNDLAKFVSSKLDIKTVIKKEIFERSSFSFSRKNIELHEHHESHAASAFFPSPYDRAAVLCVDGVGELDCTTIWSGDRTKIRKCHSTQYPHSLGILYSSITSYLGFRPNYDEYKVMGLSSYGRPIFLDQLKQAVLLGSGLDFRIPPDLAAEFSIATSQHSFFAELFGQPARASAEKIDGFHCDVAASMQALLNEEMVSLARAARHLTNRANLCVAGGVGLNCVAIGAIKESDIFDDVWVQPAASDAGGALGASFLSYYGNGGTRTQERQMSAYLGPTIESDLAELAFSTRGLTPTKLDRSEMIEKIVEALANQSVVGLARGRMEFGPRALGNRSLLANPSSYTAKDYLNDTIKKRESFRPFAPVLREENAQRCLVGIGSSPFMTVACKTAVSPNHSIDLHRFSRGFEIRSEYPAAVHVDETCRPQTVTVDQNDFLWQLLRAFEERCGIPALLNTSFNGPDEPIVCSELDAVDSAISLGLDCLILDDWFCDLKG